MSDSDVFEGKTPAESFRGCIQTLMNLLARKDYPGNFIEEAFRLIAQRNRASLSTGELFLTSTAEVAWMRFLIIHGKQGTIEERPEDWSFERLERFLKERGLNPLPFPKDRAVLLKLATHMVHFCNMCVVVIADMPEEYAALVARESTDEVLAREKKELEAGTSMLNFAVLAQIPPETKLSKCPKWKKKPRCCRTLFEGPRVLYEDRFGHCIYVSRAWVLLEHIANVFDMTDPGEDLLIELIADNETADERGLAIRPTFLRSIRDDGDGDSLPLLGVEYLYGDDYREDGTIAAGLRRESQMCSQEVNGAELDILHCLLRDNAENLALDDATLVASKKSTPGEWSFSVIRPVDPTKRGGIMHCPGCGKRATKFCSRCKVVAYCSPVCQKEQWKSHKKACKSAS